MAKIISNKELTKDTYTVGEVSEIMGVSVSTVRNWDKKSLVQFERTPTNIRILSKEKMIKLLKEHLLYKDELNNKIFIHLQRKEETAPSLDSNDSLVLLVEEDLDSDFEQDKTTLETLFTKLMNKEVLGISVSEPSLLGKKGSIYIPKMLEVLGIEFKILNKK
jgi:hypothetical protein